MSRLAGICGRGALGPWHEGEGGSCVDLAAFPSQKPSRQPYGGLRVYRVCVLLEMQPSLPHAHPISPPIFSKLF